MKKDSTGSFITRNSEVFLLIALGAIACIYLAACAINVIAALALLLAVITAYAFLKLKDAAFLTYIIVLPFSAIPYLVALPMGMSSVKLLLALFIVFAILFVMYKRPYTVNYGVLIGLIVFTVLCTAAWLRSLSFAPLAFSLTTGGNPSVLRYLIDHVAWTYITIIPMIALAYFYSTDKEIERVITAIEISLALLVCYMLFVLVFKVGNMGDFEAIRSELGKYLGMHGNDIANYFIVVFPVILAWAMYKRNAVSFTALGFITAGTILSFSRTAYFVVAIEVLTYLFFSGRSRWIPIVALVAALTVSVLMPEMIIERAATGLATGDYDEISAGRIDYIWKPLVHELGEKTDTLLLGSGRFGIMNTDAWKEYRITLVTHAHNMYLDTILDVGVVGLAVFLGLYGILIAGFARCSRRLKAKSQYRSSLLVGCIVSLISYLISGLTGRSFFPGLANAYLWVVIGLGIALCTGGLNHEASIRE